MSKIKFGILGGDYRYKLLNDMLLQDGYYVKVYCNHYIKEKVNNFEELLKGTDMLIGPIPSTKDGERIFLNDCVDIKIEDFAKELQRNNVKTYIGGVLTEKLLDEFAKYGIDGIDFFEQEAVAVKNAVPTAEGAIQIAMEESERTLFGSKSIVLGYGRCAKILSNMLKGIGANVSATYRKERDASYISAYGYEGINFYELKSHISDFEFIFNTIPALVLDRELLRRVNKNCIIIDLAQAPGGVDFNFARDINIKALYCPGLPGRVAPYTAAKILKDEILRVYLGKC